MSGSLDQNLEQWLFEEIQELEKLTDDEIAEKLEGMGIKGYRQIPGTCPLSNYFHEVTGKRVGVTTVGVVRWTVTNSFIAWPSGDESSLYHFIVKFDNGHYPDLDENEER